MSSGFSTVSVQRPFVWPDGPLPARFAEARFADLFISASLDEDRSTLAADSRWPAFFPSPICLLTSGSGPNAVVERVVGPMIVNRFPLVMAVSVCRETLSERHHARQAMMSAIESTGRAAVQFLAPGEALAAALEAIAHEPDARATERLPRSGLPSSDLALAHTRALRDAYLVYEGRLAEPGLSLDGEPTLPAPWYDIGSHRVYFLEVLAIHLKTDIARGTRQVAWHSLPRWSPPPPVTPARYDPSALTQQSYVKTYTPNYRFPASGTVAFEADETIGDMSVRHLEPLARGQVVVDNERARWPCFFPSSAGMVTAWCDDGRPTAMPCGSSGVISRLPLTFALCVSNSAINERYAPRATLATVRKRGRFGVGVPFAGDEVVRAISYLGNISARTDPDKVAHSGMTVLDGGPSPVLAQLPIHFECAVSGEILLGTHVMVLGTVDRIHVRHDLTQECPLTWEPWASIV